LTRALVGDVTVLQTLTVTEPTVAFIGAASSAGARQIGQEQTPALLRKAGLIGALRTEGVEVRDFGDVGHVAFQPDPLNRRAQNLPLVVAVAQQVAERVSAAVDAHAFPVVIGGDCTVTLGVLAGLASRIESLGLVYFDGDVDLNTPATTESGIFDGMGMAHIVGHAEGELAELGARPLVAAEKIALFGYNEQWIDPAEREELGRRDFIAMPLPDVMVQPICAAEHARAAVEKQSGSYLLHFDVDVVDYVDFPVADVPHFNGMPLGAALSSLGVFCSGLIAGLVVTEYNALRDPDGTIASRFVEQLAPRIAAAVHVDRP
jgi:arginase